LSKSEHTYLEKAYDPGLKKNVNVESKILAFSGPEIKVKKHAHAKTKDQGKTKEIERTA
jgi:hypothetical protein